MINWAMCIPALIVNSACDSLERGTLISLLLTQNQLALFYLSIHVGWNQIKVEDEFRPTCVCSILSLEGFVANTATPCKYKMVQKYEFIV